MTTSPLSFALIGAGGYIAPRHMQAIYDVGGNLVAAYDPKDSVGILDRYFPDARFYVDFERFDQDIDQARRNGQPLDFVSICSPNHMHASHIRFALRSGADAICEKPLVLDPADIDQLAAMEQATGKRVNTILQLRLHPAIAALKQKIATESGRHQVTLTYITSRGNWYHESWKGDVAKSGGVATNIGVHFFDMLYHVFGAPVENYAHVRADTHAAGFLAFEKADVSWFLSVDRTHLPDAVKGKKTTYRSLTIDGQEIEFSDGFTELHSDSYREIVGGRGFSLAEVRPCIEIVSAFRHAIISKSHGTVHAQATA